MLSRRDIAMGIGLGAVGAVMPAAAASAAGTPRMAPIVIPPKGPWTKTGDLQRAGGLLHYAMLGNPGDSKPPIVLLHKLGGWLSDWRFVAPALAQGRQVIAFDLPGHGGSRWAGPAPYIQTLGETAALLIGALDELGIGQIDLVGTSLGGCLSVPLAAFWPERVRRLALVSSALGGGHSLAEIAQAVDAKQKDLFDANGLPLPTKPELLTQIFGMVHAEAINPDGIASRNAAGHWIQPSERGVAITDIKGTLHRIEALTLLLYGEYDKAYVRFRADALAALKSGQTATVPNSGAFVMQDNPAPTAEMLAKFLDQA